MKPQQKRKLKTLNFSGANFGREGKVLREMKQEKAVEEKATKEIEKYSKINECMTKITTSYRVINIPTGAGRGKPRWIKSENQR